MKNESYLIASVERFPAHRKSNALETMRPPEQPTSYSQRRLWVHPAAGTGERAYNIFGAVRLCGAR